jgi:EipB-like
MGQARTTILLGLLAAAAPAGAPTPAAAELTSHRAAYRLGLADGERSPDLVQADGVLGIEWRVACDGWLSRQFLAFKAQTQEGEELSYDVRFSSWESSDNRRLRFTVRRFDEGGRLDEEFRGEAVLGEEEHGGGAAPGDGGRGGGVARFTVPEARTVELPPGTMFPTEHMQSVLASARSGERLVSHAVFDGSGFDALTQVTAVIGRPQRETESKEDERREPRRSWPVSMAYYAAAAGGDLPDFEVAFRLNDDGVLRELVLDYGEFRLSAVLESLEVLPPPDC